MTVFRIVLPVVLVLFVLGNVRRFFRCAKNKEKMEKGEKKQQSDRFYFG